MSVCRDFSISLRLALLGGISAGALLTGLTVTRSPASADTLPFSWVNTGPNGSNGVANAFSSNVLATPGWAGQSVDHTVSTSANGVTGTAVEIGSTGGNGGRGDDCCFSVHVTGGDGGAGGNLSLTQTGSITGQGDQDSTGLLRVYSIGGKGGSAEHGPGKGGNAGNVSVTLGASLETAGIGFAGIWARSQGGTAGIGGVNEDQVAVQTGGTPGVVTLTLNAGSAVTTAGANAPGVIAESIGGDGATKLRDSYNLDYTTQGAHGSLVSFRNTGSITTTGDTSIGAMLQSVGGHGGDQPLSGGYPGAAGGVGGSIDARQGGTISTTGAYSIGLLVQSVGGTGGQGGAGIFSGGDGGAAGAGGGMTVRNTGSIKTGGVGAAAILAQSIGGGNAGDAFRSGPVAASTGGGGGGRGLLFFGDGGEGGTGGDGGSVTVANAGTLSTAGDGAYGVFAQSVGGGGGVGGDALSLGAFVGVALGGAGGGGGNGGSVNIARLPSDDPSLTPSITTTGNSASAILAQSVGGSGGAGGAATVYTGGIVFAYAQAVGGSGGQGGNGGSVAIDSTSVITTSGVESYGIQALSVGGGGGTGGDGSAYAIAVAPPDFPAVAASVSLGGSGGLGGSSGTVTVTNDAAISTSGMAASGIQAISVGGGGGTAGIAAATVNLLSFKSNVGVSTALGGTGGGGGAGGTVAITNNASIETSGQFAQGIVALSVGGGGGAGGNASTTSKAGTSWDNKMDDFTSNLPLADALTVNQTVGGRGGSGGAGGRVSITNSNSIATQGSNSAGIFAQSVGGGGGAAGGYLGVSSGTLSASLSLGGDGGNGGNGNDVNVVNASSGIIRTARSGSFGILAQSIGGGGGLGGSFTGSVKSPASFGDDPAKFIIGLTGEILKANKIASSQFGDAKKKAEDAGFFDKNSSVQDQLGVAKVFLGEVKILMADPSVLQGLADIGLDILWGRFANTIKDQLKAAGVEGEKLPNVGLNVGLGGAGGLGGWGGTVTLQNDGTIVTSANTSYGMFAQSVGGGGGTGGGGMATGNNNLNINLTVGGSGGLGGAGGIVVATNSGHISTYGGASYGVFAQSVGGGGGLGGGASSTNTISLSGNLNLGGNGGASSNGGSVSVQNSGTISTLGYQSHALVAQSVGGGGGAIFLSRTDVFDPYALATSVLEAQSMQDAFAILQGIGAIKNGSASETSSTILPPPQVSLRIGGAGSAGGSGGRVIVDQNGAITTLGDAAFGVFAQSIGGGGGFAGDTGGTAILEAAANVGGRGGAAGDGGGVTVHFGAGSSIKTSGDHATAVFLQSIGGGGGYGGAGSFGLLTGPLPTFVSDFGSSGNGGAIAVMMRGADAQLNIQTEGAQAHGIFAQSLGGGGGMVSSLNGAPLPVQTNSAGRILASGTGGAVTIDTAGTIQAQGADSYGIFVQSGVQKADGTLDPARAGGAVSITHYGTIQGGSGNGAAIRLDGGASNTIDIASGAFISALSGQAILSSFGSDSVRNSGTVTGDVNLVAGGSSEINTFSNLPGGTYRTAGTGTVNLGPSGVFANAGIFDIGGVGTIAAATVVGNFSQHAGTMLVDVTSTPVPGQARNDVLNVKGSLRLDGTVQTNVIGGLAPGKFTIANASGPIVGSIAAASAAAGSPFLWSATTVGNTVEVAPKANFVPAAGVDTSATERAIMAKFQQAWDAGTVSADNAAIFGAFARSGSAQAFMDAIDSFSSEESASVVSAQTLGARTSMHAALSCPVFTGTGTLLEETSCTWARVIGSWVDQSGSAHVDGYDQSAVTYRVGVQREIISDWFIGATAGFTQSWVNDHDGFSSTEGNGADAAISLKHQVGPWLFAVSGHLGFGGYDTDRTLMIGPSVWTASGTSNVITAAARFRGSYEFAFSDWYLRPYADVDFLYTYVPGSTENGVGGPDLNISSADQFNVALSPNVEVGARFDLSPEMWLRPYASVGMTYLTSGGMQIGVSVGPATSPLHSFITELTIPQTLLNLGAGVQLFAVKGYEVRAEYKADIASDYLAQEASARFSVQF